MLTPVSQQRNNRGDEVEEEMNQEGTESKEQEDEIPKYESESDARVNSDDEDVITTVDTISNVATFLVGSSSRYWRSITFNKRYVSYFYYQCYFLLYFLLLKKKQPCILGEKPFFRSPLNFVTIEPLYSGKGKSLESNL